MTISNFKWLIHVMLYYHTKIVLLEKGKGEEIKEEEEEEEKEEKDKEDYRKIKEVLIKLY